jgi:NAD(P)-dependent dehydrogenase (short-subunit alcohol dehydrogenase family)
MSRPGAVLSVDDRQQKAVLEKRLNGKISLISGGANGIGRATVELFCAHGARVYFLDTDRGSGEALAARISKKGGHAVYIGCDVTSAEQIDKAVATVIDREATIDILFNHAGVIRAKPFLEYSLEDWEWMFSNNARSVFLLTRAVLPYMVERGRGVLINTSSVSAKAVTKYESVYGASKSAMHHLCRAIAVEYRDAGIRCNIICPSFVRTKHAEQEMEQLRNHGISATEDDVNLMQGRICEPEEIASVALFLASDESSFVNGCELMVDNTFTAV